jgi:xanthine dehydrogenase YagR molybdenum-binding subunit
MSLIGQPVDRIDGILKVTGAAHYSAERPQANLAYGVLVLSKVAKGTVASIDSASVEAMPGVLLVMTHLNAPRLPRGGKAAFAPPAGRMLTLLQDDAVNYQNQPVALVVADSFERATYAAHQLGITYKQSTASFEFEPGRRDERKPGPIQGKDADSLSGNLPAGLAAGTHRIDAVYTTPFEHHNPMEPHATTAVWDGDQLTLFDATQYVTGVKTTVAKVLGIDPARVRTICPFVGGGFGCKGSSWSHVVLAAMAAQKLGRPVKVVLERPQMFGPVGHRPNTEQHLMLASRDDGQLTALSHQVVSSTSEIEDWVESSAMVSRVSYAVPAIRTSHRLVTINTGTPTFTRAPGEASGSFALESAMDEMAYALRMDPVALRLKNYAETDPEKNLPFSSKALRDCYQVGAEKFGWSQRNPEPRSMKNGRELVGWGMATATYPANRSPASASVRIFPDGTAMAASGTQDLGTGTFTVMAQVAADGLGFPIEQVRFALGDSALPMAPVSGGSQSVASVSPAVRAAAESARDKLIALAISDQGSPLHGAPADDVYVSNSWLIRRSAPDTRETASTLLKRNGGRMIEASEQVKPGDERKTHTFHSFGAVFVEVRVDPDLGIVHVERAVGVYNVGRILNAKTAHSQMMGGMVWGIGAALTEESQLDTRYGRFVNANLGEYHVPVNADIHNIEAYFVGEPDPLVNSLGTRGIGEIGITGVSAAIANAVYHATGVRVRSLPITLDKVMTA